MSTIIRRDEWLAELERVMTRQKAIPGRPRGVFTVTEAVAQTGRQPQVIRDGLRAALAAGQARIVPVMISRLDGRLTTVSAYQLLPAKPPGKRKAA
jgi:hypothetical protein